MPKDFKILIVEDEMIIGANLSRQLLLLGYKIIGVLPRPDEVLPFINKQKPDIVLMDINLNNTINGIALAHLILKENKIPIIFLTANSDEQHFNKAKETNPYGFVAKPFKKIELQRAIELAIVRIETEKELEKVNSIAIETPYILSDCIFIRNHDKMIKIHLHNILYIEADRNYCKIHCNGKEHLLVSTLKDMEQKIKDKNFVRVHRSYMINLQHVDEIANTHIMIAKKLIPVSSELKQQLLQKIQKI